MIHTRAQMDDEDSTTVLDRLQEELAIARQMLEEIQDDLAWAIMNHSGRDHVAPAPLPITSMPLDPCVPDWAERLNRFSVADLPVDARAELCMPVPKQQGQLF